MESDSSGSVQPDVYPFESLVSPRYFFVFHGIHIGGLPTMNSLEPQSTNTFAEYSHGLPRSMGKGLPVPTRMITKFWR